MSKLPYEVQTEPVQPLSILSPDGEIINPDLMPVLTDDQLKEIMYRMVFTRLGMNVPLILDVKDVLVSMRQYPDKKLP